MGASKQSEKVKNQEDRSILINFVLDRSGSMESIREATISGFNEFLRDQREEGGRAVMTLTLFDTAMEMVAQAIPVREVLELDSRSYRPDGCTALFDAIGHTLRVTDDYVAAHSPDQVLFVIMTDGEENASREFDRSSIFELIAKRQKSPGYEFIYLGANQDAYDAGSRMGIAQGRMCDYDASDAGSRDAWARASRNVRSYRRSGAAQMSDDAFFSKEFEEQGALSYEEYKRMNADSSRTDGDGQGTASRG